MEIREREWILEVGWRVRRVKIGEIGEWVDRVESGERVEIRE